MTAYSQRRILCLCLLPLFVLAVAIIVRPFCQSTPVSPNDEGEYLEGITPQELLEFHKKNAVVFLPPKDIEKAREIVRKCEELWSELQEFKNEPGFSTSHLAEGTRHHDWLQRAQALNDSRPSKDEIGSDVHVLPGWLLAAAFELAGRPQGAYWKANIEERFAEYQLPIAKKAAEIAP